MSRRFLHRDLDDVTVQCVKRGDKVIASAPSNIAVDNLVERLHRERVKVVRIGHPARLLDSVKHLRFASFHIPCLSVSWFTFMSVDFSPLHT